VQHGKYWSCTPFADWIRGTKKLNAGTSKEWYDWNVQSRVSHPFRHWVAEEALGKVQDFIGWPKEQVNNLSYYINNRWVTKTHALTAHPKDIKPGSWRDVGDRFLPCMFNELVDFVEVETAGHHVAWGDEETRAKYKLSKFYWTRFYLRTWRCPEAGIDHLNWSAALICDESMGFKPGDKNFGKPTQQAEYATTILKLYHWWKNVYPNRPDPHDASGWSALCAKRATTHKEDGWMFDDKSPEERKETKKALDACGKIEKQYEDENTKMMVELIKVRNFLWT
jgi:hypothetical protein